MNPLTKTYKELRENKLKDFEFQQRRLWQLPEDTILDRQTLNFIKEFTCYKHKSSVLSVIEAVEKWAEELLTPHEFESDDPKYERFAVQLKEKYKTKFLHFLSEAREGIEREEI